MDAPSNDPRYAAADDDLQALRLGYVQSLWQGMFYVALLSLPITAWRTLATGWLPLYGIHAALATLVVVASRLQPRWPFAWRSGVMVALLWLVGVPGVFTFGLSASSIWWLVLSGVVASKLYSARIGIAMSVLTALVLCAGAVGFVGGWLQPAIAPEDYLRLPSSWAALVIVTGVFAALVLRSSGGYADATARLLRQVREQRDEIAHLSLHDALTGLPMSRLADDRVEMALHAARRSGYKVALLYVDLDGFKAVNDSFGHDAGDRVLAVCAARMRDAVRGGDTVARLGGDEFLAVAGGLEESGCAAIVAAKLIAAVSAPIEHAGLRLEVGASVGIAVYPDDGLDARTLRQLADHAMYVAKRRGRNRFAYANEEASSRVHGDEDGLPAAGVPGQSAASSVDATAS